MARAARRMAHIDVSAGTYFVGPQTSHRALGDNPAGRNRTDHPEPAT